MNLKAIKERCEAHCNCSISAASDLCSRCLGVLNDEDVPELVSWIERAKLMLINNLEREKASLDRWTKHQERVSSKAVELVIERITKSIGEIEKLIKELES